MEKTRAYIRKGILDLDILKSLKDQIGKVHEYSIINGVSVKMTSQRYAVFQKSLVCAHCGLEAKFFAIEKGVSENTENYHLNLYGYNEFGQEILFTKDHIKPKSKKGKNIISNYQTMCQDCNIRKGNKSERKIKEILKMEQNINNVNETANVRKLATVAKILSIDAIDGAENIEYAKIRGWRVVVKKGEFKVGDLCIYAEVDSLFPDGLSDILKVKYKDLKKMLSKEKDDTIKEKIQIEMSNIIKQNIRPEFEFLRNSNFRIKTREIFGQISQGICFPLSILDNIKKQITIQEDLDVTELLGVIQYVLPEATIEGGDVKGDLGQIGIITSDEERVENLEEQYERLKQFSWYRTEKMEGTSISLYLKNDDFGVCGRAMNYKQYTNGIMNNYWSTAVKLEAEEKMREFAKIHKLPNFCLQGELIGTGVQGNIYKLFEKTILFYNSFNIDASQYFYYDEFIDMIKEMNLSTVPILDTKFILPETSIELLKMVDYAKTVYGNNPEQIAEGEVFIANGDVSKAKIQRSAFGRLSFKAKSRIYDKSKK